jgi:hypothetical protein
LNSAGGSLNLFSKYEDIKSFLMNLEVWGSIDSNTENCTRKFALKDLTEKCKLIELEISVFENENDSGSLTNFSLESLKKVLKLLTDLTTRFEERVIEESDKITAPISLNELKTEYNESHEY